MTRGAGVTTIRAGIGRVGGTVTREGYRLQPGDGLTGGGVVARVAPKLARAAEGHELRFQVANGCRAVAGDPIRIEQIIANQKAILGNQKKIIAKR